MAALIIRPAVVADLPAVVALLADDMLGQGRELAGAAPHPDYGAAFAAIAANPHDALLVAELDGAVVGCFQLSFIPGMSHRGTWRGQIESVRVASGLRGQGIGRQMMAWAIARCRERGCRLVQLTSNLTRTDAHRFYRALGFEGSHLGMKLPL